MAFHHATLENGLEIVGESMPATQSVAFGFFVRAGSRDEVAEINGVSHFLEHMVFKGTERRSAEQVNREFDDVGAQYNAATSEETTLFYAAVLPEYLPHTFALQADVMFPALRTADFDTEKQVILEEIGMYDDQPSFVAYDHAMQRHYAGHPLGQTILGSRTSVGALTPEAMRKYHAERYRAGNMTLAVTGRFDWPAVVELAREHCGHWPAGTADRTCPPAQPVESRLWLPREHLQQEQIVVMWPAPGGEDPRRFAVEMLTVIVGDDTNSRLFWDLVDPGDADVAEISYQDFEGSGACLAFLSGPPENTPSNLERMQAVLSGLLTDGITLDELETARNKVSTRLVLRSERPMGRLSNLGADWLLRREYRSLEDELEILRRLTIEDLQQLLAEFPFAPVTLVGVGPLTGDA